jgi:hypothetical protein
MTVDIYIPTLSLAFEYQGAQHYQRHFKYGTPLEQQRRDQEKKEAITTAGITLIEIPYWWDMKISSLVATIRKERPDLTIAPTWDVS